MCCTTPRFTCAPRRPRLAAVSGARTRSSANFLQVLIDRGRIADAPGRSRAPLASGWRWPRGRFGSRRSPPCRCPRTCAGASCDRVPSQPARRSSSPSPSTPTSSAAWCCASATPWWTDPCVAASTSAPHAAGRTHRRRRGLPCPPVAEAPPDVLNQRKVTPPR